MRSSITVGELIKLLQALPPETVVLRHDSEWGARLFREIESRQADIEGRSPRLFEPDWMDVDDKAEMRLVDVVVLR